MVSNLIKMPYNGGIMSAPYAGSKKKIKMRKRVISKNTKSKVKVKRKLKK